MVRLFNEHGMRKTVSLDGMWLMLADRAGTAHWENGLPKEAQKVFVPSVWNTDVNMFDYEGVCWYQKDFLFEGKRALIEFEGVSGKAVVYIDGIQVSEHYGSFTAFTAEADLSKGIHRICIRVDNTYDEDTIPQKGVDWFNYGGIIRHVTLHYINNICIYSCKFDYDLNKTLDAARIVIAAHVWSSEKDVKPYTVSIDGRIVGSGELLLKKDENDIILPEVEVSTIVLWQSDNPKLYYVTLTIGCDDFTDRIGFRKIEVRDRQIYLNGDALKLKGINRHQEHPDWGFALPEQIDRRDVQIIKKLNVNIIRGSHYPNSKIFVDMLDEAGLLFWSEIPMWGFEAEAMTRTIVIKRGLKMYEEMISQYYNHPSIIIWGINNECASNTEDGHRLINSYYRYLKKYGGNRLVTYATMYFEDDISFDSCDFVSVNKYHGWYAEGKEAWSRYIPFIVEHLDEQGFSEKPVVLSEFGAASIYGYTSFDDNKWTEEYQAELICDVIEVCNNTPGVSGTFIWQYCDIRSTRDLLRARSYNNKGVVNEFRRPKLAYYAVQNKYGQMS